jgi:hypothetical protein
MTGLAASTISIFLLCATAWQFTGIWRSAGRSMKKDEQYLWPVLARGAAAVGAVQALIIASTVSVPVLRESLRLIVEGDGIPKPNITLWSDGAALVLDGGFSYGTAARVQAIVSAAPNLAFIQLDSSGGMVSEGKGLHDLIQKSGLSTYTGKECVSACTMAFLAGSQRWLLDGAKLGFHSSSFGSLDGRQLPELNDVFREVFRARGLPGWFVSKALDTRSTSIWYPTIEELRSAGVVTRVLRRKVDVRPDWLNKLNEGLPKRLDAMTTLVEVTARDRSLIYDYVVEHIDPPFDHAKMRTSVEGSVCRNEVMIKAMAEGVNYVYRYSRMGMEDLGDLGVITVSQSSCIPGLSADRAVAGER